MFPKNTEEIGFIYRHSGTSMKGLFEGCTGLHDVDIPESATFVNSNTFLGCNIPGHLFIYKDEDADKGCFWLGNKEDCVEVVIPEGVKYIQFEAFENCTGLTSIKFPESLIEICRDAFSGCTALASIHLPESVRKIGERAFEGCINLKRVDVNQKQVEIGSDAFYECPNLFDFLSGPNLERR